MINIIAEAAQNISLYSVNLDVVYAIPIVYIVSLFVCMLIREFLTGMVKIVIASIFLLSFSILWYTLMLDNAPWQYVLPVVILMGGASGLSRAIRAVLKDLKKL